MIWAAKIAAKLVLGRLPFKHQLLRGLGMFKHGFMDDAAYALKIFTIHKNAAFPDGLPAGFTALELGPGDSLASALIARAHGAAKSYHCDVGAYASQDIETYRQLAADLRAAGLDNVPDLTPIQSVPEMLALCNAEYLTGGLADLQKIPDNSVDLIWSHSVVEHIRKRDFAPTMAALHRIVKPQGRVSHNVDLQDHLQKSINNLRFSDGFWENDIVAESGFYTNRLRCQQSLNLMTGAGFQILQENRGTWDSIPLPRHKLHTDFKDLPEPELRTCTYSVLLKRAA